MATSDSSVDADADAFLAQAHQRLRQAVAARGDSTEPAPAVLARALSALPRAGQPEFLEGRGPKAALSHILDTIVPALNGQALSGRYLGFVTGGILPVAEAADNIVSALDQNLGVHLPAHSAGTAVEHAALGMLVALLDLGDDAAWPGRTFTTGATASNILGLACGREAVIAARFKSAAAAASSTMPAPAPVTVAEAGLLAACQAAGVREIQVLTSMAHSSLVKAASVLGLGHAAVKELPASADEPWRLDLDAVERELARDPAVASIIAVSAGEVNTGRFATNALDMPKLRSLANRYGAWLHVDGAFGIFARALPQTDEFLSLRANTAGLELADSITADGHKLLNVPYDAGIFLCRDAAIQTQVFSNPNAAYLATPPPAPTNKTATTTPTTTPIHSPLNMGLENSRRFRALPVYATLLSAGRAGTAEMLARMVRLARAVAGFVRDSPDYEWLPDPNAPLESTHIIVLFRARNAALNEVLVDRVNATRALFVSGTSWAGRKAARIAVSSWRVDVDADFAVIKRVLTTLAAEANAAAAVGEAVSAS